MNKLARQTFTTSRLMDFFTEKELIAQIGHQKELWALVAVKELVDNALDACEDQAIAPEVKITAEHDKLSVTDNGPGICPKAITGILDYAVRVSSREAYVSPTRGAQGNALKTLVAMPFVLNGQEGHVTLESQGIRHSISCRVDRIRQEPIIEHRQEPSVVENGTLVTVQWPDSASSILSCSSDEILQMARDYAVINPHLDLAVTVRGKVKQQWKPTSQDWITKKWLPSNPTSPHWYRQDQFERLIAGYIASDQDHRATRTVRAFVAEFHGLAAPPKQKLVLEQTGLARLQLSDLVKNDEIDHERAASLLAAMKAVSKPVKPEAIGLIGKEAIARRFDELHCHPETFRYTKDFDVIEGVPVVYEIGFGAILDDEHKNRGRTLITGVNWSAAIGNPFKHLKQVGMSLDAVLENLYCGSEDDIVMLVHVATPRANYTDRGKSTVILEG